MKKSRKILIGLCILIAVLCIGYIVYYYVKQTDNSKVYEEVQKQAEQKGESEPVEAPEEVPKVEIPIDFVALQGQNPDIYAWIQIEGTSINYPVVQSATDNVYYLDHTIEGQAGYPGSIYTENGNTKEFTEFNTVIYGHDMKDGSMFQNLHNYTDPTYFDSHSTVIVYTADKKLTYRVFAAVIYDDRHIMHSFDFGLPEGRQAFLNSLSESRYMGNLIDSEIPVNADSRILTLSTCMTGQDDKRFLVEAVLENEEK